MSGPGILEIKDGEFDTSFSWLIVSKTMNGYCVYQNHPAFTHDDRVPRPLAVFPTKAALVEWIAAKWNPRNPDHEFKSL